MIKVVVETVKQHHRDAGNHIKERVSVDEGNGVMATRIHRGRSLTRLRIFWHCRSLQMQIIGIFDALITCWMKESVAERSGVRTFCVSDNSKGRAAYGSFTRLDQLLDATAVRSAHTIHLNLFTVYMHIHANMKTTTHTRARTHTYTKRQNNTLPEYNRHIFRVCGQRALR